MKYSIIYSGLEEGEFGVTIVRIQTRDGIFTGRSKCSPEDFDNDRFSLFTGERYAETRAVMNWIKFKKKKAVIQKQALDNLLIDINLNINNSKKNPMIKRIYYKLNFYENKIKEYNNEYNALKNSIIKMDKEREDILNEYQKDIEL